LGNDKKIKEISFELQSQRELNVEMKNNMNILRRNVEQMAIVKSRSYWNNKKFKIKIYCS